jgi:hypothetical protein
MNFTVEYLWQALSKETEAMKLQPRSGRLTALAMAGVALMTLAFTTPAAQASVFTFKTPSGATDQAGDPVSAEADFTLNNGTLTITLKDLLANPKDAGQLLSDLFYTVNSGSPGTTLSSSSGQEISVDKNGNATTGSTVAAGWAFSTSGTTGLLNVLAGGAAGPAHLIIGPPGPGGVYTNANGSIAGNKPHNPFLNQSATFTITGVTGTSITGVTFSFGTQSGDNVTGVPSTVVPEPSTMALAGLGALGFLGYGLRRRLKK